jgi:hypothetical protein
MAVITIPIPKPSIIRPAAVYVAQFGGIGAFFPLFPVYLGFLGLPLGTVGLLIALHALVSLLAAPGWGESIIGGQLAGALTLPGLFALAALGTWFGAVVIWRSSRTTEPLIAGAR